MLLPAALMAYLAFNSGGFYPAPPAFLAAVLCILLAMRVTLAEHPSRVNRRLVVAAGAMALFALETLLSQEWSHAPGVALVEFDWPLLYLLAIVLFGSISHREWRLALSLRALAVALVLVCACGLITHLLPHVWPTGPQFGNRLSYPVGYPNALGLLAAIGLVLSAHFASDAHERASVRVLAAAAIPVQACTLYFTFSRGGILVGLVAVVAYVVLGRPRTLLSAAIATVPASVVAVWAAYHANALATGNPTSSHAVAQGHHVAIAVAASVAGAGLLRGLLLRLDRRLEQLSPSANARRRAAWVAGAGATVTVAVIGIVLHTSIGQQYHRFLSSTAGLSSPDPRSRLTDPANGLRLPLWRVAWHGFESAPLIGHGAGTFAYAWAEQRQYPEVAADAHSLYLEVLDELGVVGFILLVTTMAIVLVCAARRIRGPTRPLYAAVFAVLLLWAIHAGLDWDWELPVGAIIFFSLGGMVLAPPAVAASSEAQIPRLLAPQRRVVLGLVCLLLGVAPSYVWLSQRKLDQASAAYSAGNCGAATSAANSSISILGSRSQPYEILAYCDARRDLSDRALAAIEKAVSLDPHNPTYALDLSIIRAAAGLDPTKAAQRAFALYPLDPDARTVWAIFKHPNGNPTLWRAYGHAFVNYFNSL
jgi:O-antigen ligase